MWRPHLRLGLIAVALLTACSHPNTAEKRVIGKWQFNSMDAASLYILKPNHTFDIMLTQPDGNLPWDRAFSGRWRVEGTDVILDQDPTPMVESRSTPIPAQTTRIPIAEFGPNGPFRPADDI